MGGKYISPVSNRLFIWRIEYADGTVAVEFDKNKKEDLRLKEAIPMKDITTFGFAGLEAYFYLDYKGIFHIQQSKSVRIPVSFYLEDTPLFTSEDSAKIFQLKGFEYILDPSKGFRTTSYVFGYRDSIEVDHHILHTQVSATIEPYQLGRVRTVFEVVIAPEEPFDAQYTIFLKNNGKMYDTRQKINCNNPRSSIRFH